MLGPRLRTGIRVGLLAAAATAGVLIGLGLRHDAALTPFLLYGRSLVASFSSAIPPSGVALVVGALAHGFWMLVWGACFTLVAGPLRGRPLAVASGLYGVLCVFGVMRFFPVMLGALPLASLTVPQSLLLVVVLALVLFLGTRIARE
ncbi:MAG TPA: hypothetical protein VLE53_14210 [Gemmatimonadaceae bacterium]|nr:hypothetical protein [Gemmatimonadaceae bacterium]